jgi:hypothetical protein
MSLIEVKEISLKEVKKSERNLNVAKGREGILNVAKGREGILNVAKGREGILSEARRGSTGGTAAAGKTTNVNTMINREWMTDP